MSSSVSHINIRIIEKSILFFIICSFLCGRVFSQNLEDEMISEPWQGVVFNGVCWAKSNVDKPGTFASTPRTYGMLYQWETKKGWIATDFDTGGDSIISVNDPCPAGWRMPTIDEAKTLIIYGGTTVMRGIHLISFHENNSFPVFFPVVEFLSENYTAPVPRYGYWSGSVDMNDSVNAWMYFFIKERYKYHKPLLAPRDYPFLIRCVADEKCDSIVRHDTVSINATDLPYERGDTTFLEGTKTGRYRIQRRSCAYTDLVYLHLTVHQPFDTTFYDTVCCGASYNQHGFSLSNVQEDKIYTLSSKTEAGCDSTLTLYLIVHPVYDTTLYDTICEGGGYYKYGLTLDAVTESCTHTQPLQTVHGCDSTVTLNLHVWPTYLFPESKDICAGDTIDFRGRKLYKTGVYDDSLTTIHGCDSIFRMDLTVHSTALLYFSDAICSGHSYSNHGFHLPVVYRDTVIQDTFRTSWGCDSVRTLTLTVHPVYDTTLYDTICQGDAYHNYGFNLPSGTSSDTFTETYSTIHGCDSIVTLNLHVWPKYFYSQTENICAGDTIDFRGHKLYQSGIYDDTLTSVHGCDSVYRMILTVHSTAPLYFSDAICSGHSYSNHGFHLPAVYRDTIVRDTYQTSWGCDSIRILSLTVHPVYDTLLYDTVCQGDSYDKYGFSLSNIQSDCFHTQTLPSRWGCDSVVNLQLTVHPEYHTVLYDSICPSARYDKYGFKLSNITESLTHTRKLPTIHGCDSIVTLELYVYPTYFYPRTENICEGDTFDFRGRRFYESGTYYDSLKTVQGCDSIYCLYLSVHSIYDVPLSGVLCEGVPYTRYGFNVATPGVHYRYLTTVAGCDSTLTLTLSEEKKIEGAIGLSLADCSLHGYEFFFEPVVPQSTWLWDMGDGSQFHTSDGYHTYADSGLYRIQLRLETSNGCENRYSYRQYVPPYLPEVPIRTSNLFIDEEYPTVHFRAEVLPGMRCMWEFGDGTTGEGDRISHTYDAHSEKYYDVLLKVINADSCITESRARIEVLFFPKSLNTFSPNGDGVNDVFMPDYRIEIINRNGLRIYTGDNGWDGTYKGVQAPADTYFYRLYYRTAVGERMKTGYVTLIR